MLEGKNLYKDKSKYFSLIYSTSITGAYNLYLDKNKKAIAMLLTLFASIIMSHIVPICGLLGFIINITICIIDRKNGEKDIYKYNEKIKSILTNNSDCSEIFDIKCGSLKDYKLNILTFGLIGLDKLYVEGCSVNSSRHNHSTYKSSSIRLTLILLYSLVSMVICLARVLISSGLSVSGGIKLMNFSFLSGLIFMYNMLLILIKSYIEYQPMTIIVVCTIIGLMLFLCIRRKLLKSEAIFSKYSNNIEDCLFWELNKIYNIEIPTLIWEERCTIHVLISMV